MKTILAIILGITSLFGFCSKKSVNPVTGKEQYVSLTPQQEISLGLKSVDQMGKMYGGIEKNSESDIKIDQVGEKIIKNSIANKSPYKFEFNVLKDNKTINAFALPGGQVFITNALLKKLKTDAQIAGVLGHEIAHVIERHSAQQMAKASLTSGEVQAISIGTFDANKSQYAGDLARIVAGLTTMKYGRKDETESDMLGLSLMSEAGYHPKSMKEVMRILEEESKKGMNLEFFSTHPNPTHRITDIDNQIKKIYPNGVPSNLEK